MSGIELGFLALGLIARLAWAYWHIRHPRPGFLPAELWQPRAKGGGQQGWALRLHFPEALAQATPLDPPL